MNDTCRGISPRTNYSITIINDHFLFILYKLKEVTAHRKFHFNLSNLWPKKSEKECDWLITKWCRICHKHDTWNHSHNTRVHKHKQRFRNNFPSLGPSSSINTASFQIPWQADTITVLAGTRLHLSAAVLFHYVYTLHELNFKLPLWMKKQ